MKGVPNSVLSVPAFQYFIPLPWRTLEIRGWIWDLVGRNFYNMGQACFHVKV